MSTLEQRKTLYQKSSLSINERDLHKFRLETNDYFCRYETELIELTNKIPNWKTYLTNKQLKIMELYLSFRNTSAIDIHLGLTNGIAYHTLFGGMKNNKQVGGVLKKLKNANDVLEKINQKRR